MKAARQVVLGRHAQEDSACLVSGHDFGRADEAERKFGLYPGSSRSANLIKNRTGAPHTLGRNWAEQDGEAHNRFLSSIIAAAKAKAFGK